MLAQTIRYTSDGSIELIDVDVQIPATAKFSSPAAFAGSAHGISPPASWVT